MVLFAKITNKNDGVHIMLKRCWNYFQPFEHIILCYIFCLNLIFITFSWDIALWAPSLLSHTALILFMIVINLIHEESAWWLYLIKSWYFYFIIVFLYQQINTANGLIHDGTFDYLIIQWETSIFGSLPTLWLYSAIDMPLLTDILSIAYISYLFIGGMIVFPLYWKKDKLEFSRFKFVSLFIFCLSYLFFVIFPVAGPQWCLEEAQLYHLNGLYMLDLLQKIQGQSPCGAAFPSSHVSASTVLCLYVWYTNKKLARFLTIPLIMIMLSTVYLMMHFVLDAIAGVVFGVMVFYLSYYGFEYFYSHKFR